MENLVIESPLSQLRKEIIHQKTAHLDEPSHCPLCIRAYEQFQAYAAFVTQHSIEALQGNPQAENYPHWKDLEEAMEELRASLAPEDMRFYRLLQNAKQRLDTILALIHTIAQEGKS